MFSAQQLAPAPGQQQPTTRMLPTDYEAMFQDVSNHMSRSEFLRRLSAHSSSTSNSSKRGITRITKQASASNSPHNVQRRRTTANHTTRANCRISHDSPFQTREQRLQNYYCSEGPTSFQRPMSWHPGSDDYESPCPYIPSGEAGMGNTIVGLENLAVSGTPASAVQQSIQDAFSMGYGHPINAPTTKYETSPPALPGYGTISPATELAYDSYPTYSISDVPQYPPIPQVTTCDPYPATDYHLQQQWSQYGPNNFINSQIPQHASDYLPAQVPVDNARQSKARNAPRLSRKRSKELVGMGLYDDKTSNFMSSLNSAVSEDPNRDSVGKGLKLEETWQPPNEDEDDEDEDDEAYSTDEAEEVEEAPTSVIASASAEAQTVFYPRYGDLSNQSFFFNDDDEYMNDNHFTNYLAYEQGLEAVQAKPPLNPGMENYLWF